MYSIRDSACKNGSLAQQSVQEIRAGMWAYVVLHFKLCVHPCSAFYPLPLLMHVEERMFANQWAADHRLKALREEAECAAAQERNVEQIKVRLISQSHCAKSRDTCTFSICGMKMTTSMHQVSGGSKILVYYYSTPQIVLSSVCGGV